MYILNQKIKKILFLLAVVLSVVVPQQAVAGDSLNTTVLGFANVVNDTVGGLAGVGDTAGYVSSSGDVAKLSTLIGGFVGKHPVLKAIFKHRDALRVLGNVMTAYNAADSIMDQGTKGEMVADAMYQAIHFAATTFGTSFGATAGATLGTAVGPGVGTFLGGFLGGVAGAEAFGLAVDLAFEDSVRIGGSYLGVTVSGLGLRDIIANAIDNNQSAASVGSDFQAEIQSSQSQSLSDIQQQFNQGGFLNTNAVYSIGIGGLGLIRGQLVWSNNTDLDLHLILPAGAGHVAYYNTSVSFGIGNAAIAELDHDNLGGSGDVGNLRVENIAVTGTNIPQGAYQFYVQDYSERNGSTTWGLTLTGDSAVSGIQYSGVLSGSGQRSATYSVSSRGGSF